MPSQLALAERLALKAATRRLIDRVGGVEAAAGASRLSRAHLARCYHPYQPDMLPLDAVAELEAAAGVPEVTTALARMSGHVLSPVSAEPGGPELLLLLAQMMQTCGSACTSGVDAMSDGELDRQEIMRLLELVHAVGCRTSTATRWLKHELDLLDPEKGPEGAR